jgi:hypothetical protein
MKRYELPEKVDVRLLLLRDCLFAPDVIIRLSDGTYIKLDELVEEVERMSFLLWEKKKENAGTPLTTPEKRA